MRDSTKTEAERTVQHRFSKTHLITGACLVLAVVWSHSQFIQMPNRFEIGPRTMSLHNQPQPLEQGAGEVFGVVGGWRLLTEDSRFGGISALAMHRGGFVALTDSGVVARFPKPSADATMRLHELPDGPGSPHFKVNRDSEALTADPSGRGWWVSFENRDQLWLYDPALAKARARVPIKSAALGPNRGIEGMVADGAGLLLFPEKVGSAIHTASRNLVAIRGVSGWISEAARLPDGRILVANRRPTPIGLSNYLIILENDGSGYRAGASWRVPVGRLDNVEALAVEPRANGGAIIWMMTDNNLQRRRPTLLLAVELRPRPAG